MIIDLFAIAMIAFININLFLKKPDEIVGCSGDGVDFERAIHGEKWGDRFCDDVGHVGSNS